MYEVISFHKEGGEIPAFKKTFLTKYINIFRRVFFKDKNYLYRRHEKYVKKQFTKRMKTISKKHSKINYSILIMAEDIPKEGIQICRNISDNLISYQHDGMYRSQRLFDIINYFDKIFTFDPQDMNDYQFLPLTNCWFPDENKKNISHFHSDIFYVGVGVPERIEKIKSLQNYSTKNNIKLDVLLTVPPHVTPEQNNGVRTSHTGISYEDNLAQLQSSKTILDMKLPYHNGLSFRFFEALYYEKKIITNNFNVRHYDFYHPDNVFMTDFKDFSGLKEFLEKPYHKVDPKLVDKYSVENWLRYVLDLPPYQNISLPPLSKEQS